MTIQEMVTELSNRVEDSANDVFTTAEVVEALNGAQLSLVSLIHPDYLHEIEVREFNLSSATVSGDDESSLAFSSLSHDVIKILSVKINSGEYAVIVPYEEAIRRRENSLLAGTDDNPVAWVHNDRIYIQTTTANPSIDVAYIKRPTDLAYPFTVDSFVGGGSASPAGNTSTIICDALASEVDDYYNGMVVYNSTQGYYGLVYHYVGYTKKLYIVHESSVSYFAVSDMFYFISGAGAVEKLSDESTELAPSLERIMLDFAEAHLWRTDHKADRAANAENAAIAKIQSLNSLVAV